MWMDTILTFLIGVVTGGCLVGTGLWYVLSFFFHDPDDKKNIKGNIPDSLPTSPTFQLPPILLSKISDESFKSKENCWALNFIFYFLFRELKNSEGVRRWVLRKLSLEFDELLATSVLGKFFSNITIQNIDLGQNFPIVNWLKTTKVEVHPVFKSISTLDILLDLDYAGGFQFSIKAESHLKHSAFLSIQFNEVKGQARLQFSSDPYAHWSFSFADNPEIDISVVSQLYGKSINQVTAIIASQLKRSVKKKHTLPMYKIRYKPFFNRIQPFIPALSPNGALRVETTGILVITLVECRGLMMNILRGNVFCNIGIGNFDWVATYDSSCKNIYVVRDIGYFKTPKRQTKLDFRLMQQGDVPIIESLDSVTPKGIRNIIKSSTECEFEPGDEIISVDGKRVYTIKQCIKYFRNSTSVRVLWRIRRIYYNPDWNDTLENYEEIQNNPNEQELSPNLFSNGGGIHSQNSSRRNSFAGEHFPSDGSLFKNQLPNPNQNQKIHQLFKTNQLPGCRDPIFQESFNFNLEESHQFINITCWSTEQSNNSSEVSPTSSPTSSPVKRPKVVTVDSLPFGRNFVIGSISIPLSDVVSECSTTGMGFFTKDYYLGPPDGISASDARDHDLKLHSGFEPTMCYGKITLSFKYKYNDNESGKRKQSYEGVNIGGTGTLDLNNEIGVTGRDSLPSPGDEPQSHKFIRTHFRSSAVCDYCNKKIWLKEAYVCELCCMKCHKKCNERCVANTICRGFVQRGNIFPTANPEIITTQSESTDTGNGVDEDQNIENDGLRPIGGQNNIRRRTLGGLIASAVQSRSAQLKRSGSATTLDVPTTGSSVLVNSITGTKSLPPSPQSSPSTSRKTSGSREGKCGGRSPSPNLINPFLVLDPEGIGEISQKNLDEAVEVLILRQREDLVSLAKESGREIYLNQSIQERKQKLNGMLIRLQEEIDILTKDRRNWTKEETLIKNKETEDKIQALALLMLHFCAGLQYIQESIQDNENYVNVKVDENSEVKEKT